MCDKLHSEIFKASIYLNLDYGIQLMKTPNSVSQKIGILHKISLKKIYFNTEISAFLKVCSCICTRYLVVAWHGVDDPGVLLRCNGSPGFL